jgi:hypothetical protein
MTNKKLTGYMPPQPGYSRLSKQALVNAVDPQIREVMHDLLLNGFITTSSCAGHTKPGNKPFLVKRSYAKKGEQNPKQYYVAEGLGYIVFTTKGFNEALAKQIMVKHGLTGLRTIKVVDYNKPHYAILFDAIGVKQTPRYLKEGGGEGAMWESAYVGTGITW